jgi:hypothetical protein
LTAHDKGNEGAAAAAAAAAATVTTGGSYIPTQQHAGWIREMKVQQQPQQQ